MTQIVDDVMIDVPVADLYDFVTTPATWPKWHPSSLGVSDAIDHSLEVGERVTEEFLVAGRRGQVVWTVTAKDAPRTWTISGKVIGGGQGVITYHCRPDGDGTIFEREFTYSMSSLKLEILNVLIFKRRVKRESAQAVRQLKAAIERERSAQPAPEEASVS